MRLTSPYMRAVIVAGYILVLATLLLVSRGGLISAQPFQSVLPQTTSTLNDNHLGSETNGLSELRGVCRDAFEPDDERAEAAEIYPNATQNRVICPEGDEDWIAFSSINGKVYTIDVPRMVDGLDLSLTLYDEAGEQLAFNDDFPHNDDPHDIKPRIQSWQVPDDGRYFIRVRDNAGHGGTGLAYTIVLQSESLCSDRFEPDGSPELAKMILIREVQQDRTFCPGGDIDWVRFFVRASQRYVLRVDSKLHPGVDPTLVVMDRDGASELATMDEGATETRVEFQPPVDGIYYARLTNAGDIGGPLIKYNLYFEFADAAPALDTSVPISPTPRFLPTPAPEPSPPPKPTPTPMREASPAPAYPGPGSPDIPTPLPNEP
jgi:hypothetical protein